MAEETIAVKITADAGQANESVSSLKQKLQDATKELISMKEQFGETSDQAVEASQKVKKLEGAISEAKAMAKELNKQKFETIFKSVEGAVKGFTALHGAVALVGIESEKVEKLFARVQGAMEMAEGIAGVFNAIDSFKELKNMVMSYTIVTKIARTVQMLWNAAMTANPIGLLVAAIAAVVAGIANLVQWFISSAKAAEQQEAAVNASTEAYEKQKKAIQESSKALEADSKYIIELAKAQGKSTEEIRKLILAEQDKKIALLQAAQATQQAKLIQDEYTLSTLKAADADEELIKKAEENVKNQTELVNTTTESVKSALDERKEKERSFVIEDAANAKKAADDKLAKIKENNQKIAEANKQRNEKIKEDNKSADKQAEQLRQENFLNSIKDEQERAEEKAFLDYKNAIKELDASTASEKNKAEVRKELNKKFWLEIGKIEDDAAVKRKEKEDQNAEELKQKEEEKRQNIKAALEAINQIRIDAISDQFEKQFEQEDVRFEKEKENLQKQFDDKLITEEQRKAALENLEKIHGENLTKIINDRNASTQEIEEKAFEARMKLMEAVGNGLTALSDVVGNETRAGKALAVASSLINTYAAIAGQLRAFSGKPIPGFAIAQAIATGLVGFKAVRDIIKTPIPGGGGGGSAAVPTASAAVAQMAPIQPQAQTTRIDQQQINQIGNAAVRSYVLETDVANNQERRIRIERAARIG